MSEKNDIFNNGCKGRVKSNNEKVNSSYLDKNKKIHLQFINTRCLHLKQITCVWIWLHGFWGRIVLGNVNKYVLLSAIIKNNTMRQLLISTIIFILINNITYSQTLDTEFFLLGTLSDYMGRQKDNKDTNTIEQYNIDEKLLADTLYLLLKREHSDVQLNETECNWNVLTSVNLKNKIETYYDYYPTVSLTMTYDTIYAGKLKSKIFNNENQKYSFLLGAYLRYGLYNDNFCTYYFGNSISKANIIYELLKELKCTDVTYKINKRIPAGHVVKFKPNATLNKILQEYRHLGYFSADNERNRALEKQLRKKILKQ